MHIPILNYHLSWDFFFPFALWHIWTDRNHNVFNETNMLVDIKTMCMRAMEYMFCTGTSTSSIPTKNIHVRWFPPPPGSFKLNTDGSFYAKDKTGGIGGVIRNANGEWVIGFSKKVCALNHTHAELSALEHELHLVIDHQLTLVEIETDSIEVIELLNEKIPIFNNLINSCRFHLKRLGNLVIRHSFREGNKVAHALANKGSKKQSSDNIYIF